MPHWSAAEKKLIKYLIIMKNRLVKIARVATMVWFTLSFVSLSIVDPTPMEAAIIIVNFGLSGFVAGRIHTKESDRA